MGLICRVCDRKFFMFKTYEDNAVDIEHQEILIKSHLTILKEKEIAFSSAR